MNVQLEHRLQRPSSPASSPPQQLSRQAPYETVTPSAVTALRRPRSCEETRPAYTIYSSIAQVYNKVKQADTRKRGAKRKTIPVSHFSSFSLVRCQYKNKLPNLRLALSRVKLNTRAKQLYSALRQCFHSNCTLLNHDKTQYLQM